MNKINSKQNFENINFDNLEIGDFFGIQKITGGKIRMFLKISEELAYSFDTKLILDRGFVSLYRIKKFESPTIFFN